MRRINTEDGFYHDGNPATGALGTPVPAVNLNALQEEVCSVIELAGGEVNPASNRQLYDAIVATIAAKVNAPLVAATTPTTNVGNLIFVLDRMHWATWVQTAFYTGYRSLYVGDWYIGSMCLTHRPQEIDAIGGIYDIAAYPSLWGWAQEQGKVVDAGDWEPHGTQYALIGTTQFRVPDYRDMFPRAAGTDRDTANAILPGAYRPDAFQGHTFGSAAVPSSYMTVIQNRIGSDSVGDTGTMLYASPSSAYQVRAKIYADASNGAPRVSSETRGASSRVAAVVLI